ncbi:MAG: tetratricopeptide repeat protein [Rubrivivax sp.]|nr:tetratricopeptide repeat protein [Rubrivivax sp.]
MPESPRRRIRALALVAACAVAGVQAAPVPPQPSRSALDAQLFYQLLIGEMQLRNGDPGTAYRAFLEAAKRTADPALFRRAMDVALQARAGNEALAATQSWREAQPDSPDPIRLQLQILAALNRVADAREPTAALIELTPASERSSLITALPRLFERATDKRQTADMLQAALAHYASDEATRTAVAVSRGRAWLAADEPDRALELALQAARQDPAAAGPALLALELLPKRPASEQIVIDHLARPGTEPALRLAYVQALMASQRFPDAVAQLQIATSERPEIAPPFLTLGALQAELRQFDAADVALQRYVALVEGEAAAPTVAPAASAVSAADADAPDAAATSEDAPSAGPTPDRDNQAKQGLVQAWLLLAQVAEQRGDYGAAERWLSRIDDPRRALQVQVRRALIMARQGKVDEAVASLRQVPERNPGDARAKLVAEAQLLRDVERFPASYAAFAVANERFPDDTELLYEQAMVAERIGRLDDMERLLRRVIEVQPDHAHAHNALGYSLADRGLRLPEARALIQRALELTPGDPFITDSLGWVEFRLGNLEEAERQLRTAWRARPDTEIGAHLGEVLWSRGLRDEARGIWRQAQARDSANAVLRETLARLQVSL